MGRMIDVGCIPIEYEGYIREAKTILDRGNCNNRDDLFRLIDLKDKISCYATDYYLKKLPKNHRKLPDNVVENMCIFSGIIGKEINSRVEYYIRYSERLEEKLKAVKTDIMLLCR